MNKEQIAMAVHSTQNTDVVVNAPQILRRNLNRVGHWLRSRPLDRVTSINDEDFVAVRNNSGSNFTIRHI
eukprot:m.259589 g.259589  ORF g.259589 m.259589 type:complete len:70 (+) comp19667_c0_seq8:243-452(+)